MALGHHREDVIETLLLNQFYNGTIKAMAPLLAADDGRNVVIRPSCTCPRMISSGMRPWPGFPSRAAPARPAATPDMKRVQLKKLLAELERRHPGIKASLLSALARVDQRHLFTPSKSVTEPDGRNEAPKRF